MTSFKIQLWFNNEVGPTFLRISFIITVININTALEHLSSLFYFMSKLRLLESCLLIAFRTIALLY